MEAKLKLIGVMGDGLPPSVATLARLEVDVLALSARSEGGKSGLSDSDRGLSPKAPLLDSGEPRVGGGDSTSGGKDPTNGDGSGELRRRAPDIDSDFCDNEITSDGDNFESSV